MHEAERLAIRIRQLVCSVRAGAGLSDQAHRDAERNGLLVVDHRTEEIAKAHTQHVLHRDERGALGFTQLVDLHDVGMIEPRHEARLLQEHLAEGSFGREVRQRALDHHQPLEAVRATLQREEDLRHATDVEPVHELEAPEVHARRVVGGSHRSGGERSPHDSWFVLRVTPRGFPNIGLVRDAIGVLVPAIKKGKLPPPAMEPWEGHIGFPIKDPVIGVQHLARKIAKAYELSVGTVIVTFIDGMKEAGRVELSGPGQRDFFVELRAEFKEQPRVITAILGHEIAHIFLHHHRVHLAPGLPEEILTDATAVLYGFGAVMADTFRVSEKSEYVGDNMIRTTRSERHMGYLTPDEMGYVLMRSGFGGIDEKLESLAARDALAVGRSRARSELTAPPLKSTSWWRRAIYKVLRWWAEWRKHAPELHALDFYRVQAGKVLFRCTVCCQGIRVPTRASLTATCPRCETELPCET